MLVVLGLGILSLVQGCHRGGATVRHGDLSYNLSEVFGDGTRAFALAEAAGRGDVQEIDRQIAAGANVNAVGQHGITPLWWAAWTENYKGFAALLDKGANPNAQRKERYPIMILIADIEDARFLEAALKHGGDPNLRDGESGQTPLFPAVMSGRKPLIDLLLAAKTDVNAELPVNRWTPMIVAMSSRNDYQLVYRLLQAGADSTRKTADGGTIADYIEVVSRTARNNNNPWRAKVLEYLASKGVKAGNPASTNQ